MNKNEAIGIVKKNWPDGRHQLSEALETLIPELKESEDEKIRKCLINYFNDFSLPTFEGLDPKKILAWFKKQGNPKMSAEALREGVAHYGITQYQINNWLKKYVEIESTEPESSVLPKYGIGDVIRLKNSDQEFIINRITDGYYHSKGACIQVRIADDVNGDWEYARHIQPKPKFNVGDTIIAKPENCMEHVLFHITSIEGGFYWDGDNSILIDNQDDFVLVGKLVKEPAHKFNLGDWIISNEAHEDYRICKITNVENGNYTIESIYGYKGYNTFETFEKSYHLWTIQDAKDGDILAEHETIVLFKEIDGLNIRCYCTYHYLGFNPELRVDTLHNKEPYFPATQEQRDLLFQKIKEVGYEWDVEKKELKKIEQNPAWSEKNEAVLDALIRRLEGEDIYVSPHLAVECLKSLKERYTWKPSDEQMYALIKTAKHFGGHDPDDLDATLESLYNDLKKLKG